MGGMILKIPSVSHARKSGRGRGLTSKLLKVFFLPKSWSCPQAYRCGDCWRKLPLAGATDFLSIIWHHIRKVSRVSAFHIVLTRKPKNASKSVLIGPKHNLVYFKSSWWCLFIQSWSSSHHMYAGKRCNGNPIYTKITDPPPTRKEVQLICEQELPEKLTSYSGNSCCSHFFMPLDWPTWPPPGD